MRTFFATVLLVLGVPVLVAGAIVAIYAGPDDTVGLVDEEISTDTAVLVTDPTALDITGPTVHLTVSGATETFVGIAHPVHVDSYLEGVAADAVTDVSWRGDLTRAAVSGEQEVPAAAAGGLDWWHRHSVGPGPQKVSVKLTDQPLRVVVTRAEPAAPFTANIKADLELGGLFVTGLLVAAAGLALIVGGFLMVRGRRVHRRIPDRSDENGNGAGPHESPPVEPTPLRRAGHRTAGRRPPGGPPGTVARLGGIGGACALALVGCAQPPGSAEHDAHTSVVAVSPSAADAFFERYTEVNNQANAEQDAEAIATVETGTLLKSSRMGYRIQQAQNEDPLAEFAVVPSIVAAPKLDAYPMWFFAASEPEDAVSGPGYYLVTRENAASPWLVTLTVYPSADAPRVEPLVSGGAAEVATPANGEAVLDAIVEYASTGAEPEDIDVSHAGGLGSLHEQGLQISGDKKAVEENRECSLTDDELHWLRTASGAFAMAAVSCTQTMRITDDEFHISLGDNGFGTIPGGTRLSRSEITQGVSFVVTVNDDGSAAVIGESMVPYAMDHTAQ